MDRCRPLLWGLVMLGMSLSPAFAEEEVTAFAVVSETPKDKAKVAAKLLIDGTLSEVKLLPSETVIGNPIWRSIEICHALKLEGVRSGEGFKIRSARVLDAGMLPMALQGFAGDCLIKKAVEIAPMAD